MDSLFVTFNELLSGSCLAAALGAFLWGIASVVLSPCHLGSLPLLVAFISGQQAGRRRTLLLSSLFALGVLLSIWGIGFVTTGLGRIAGDLGGWGNFLMAALFLLMGLNLLEVFQFSWTAPDRPLGDRKGPAAAFLLGLLFGIALGPCTFAYLAPVLSIAFHSAEADPRFGFLLVGLYGVGHASVLITAGVSTATVQRLLNWNQAGRGLTYGKYLCGVLLILGGLYLIYSAA